MTPFERNSFSRDFSRFILDHPWRSISLALVLVALLVPGLRYMEADFGYRIWFRSDDPLLSKFDAFERRFGNDEMVAVVVHSPTGIFDRGSVAILHELTEEMWQVPEVIRVESLTNYNWTHADGDELIVEPLLDPDEEMTNSLLQERKRVALEHEIIPGYLVSRDGKTAIIYSMLKPAIGGTPDFEVVVGSVRAVCERYKGRDDHEYFVTGPAVITQTFKDVTQADLQKMVPILFMAILLFLWLSFRRLSGVLIPTLLIFLCLLMTLGFAGWFDIKFNNLTAAVPHILIAISVADTVHILVTFFQFRGSGVARREAAHLTLVKNLTPTLLTSVSTSIGFFSYFSAKIVPVVHMGILAGVGTLMAWLITIFLIGPLMAYLPIKVKTKQTQEEAQEPHPLAIRYAGWLQNNRNLLLAFFTVLVAVAAYLALQNEVNSNPFKYFAEKVPIRIANEFAEQEVGGMMGMEIVVDSGKEGGAKQPAFLKKVETFQQWLDSRDHITKTVALTDIVKQVNRSLHEDDPSAYVIPDEGNLAAEEIFLYSMSLPANSDITNRLSLDESMLRLTAMSRLHESKPALKEIQLIEAKGKELGLELYVTGKMPLYQNMNPYVVTAFISSISLALVLVSVLMIFAFRSWKLGLLSMIPNTVPLVFGGAIMTLLHKPLDIGTVLVTSTCLGIAVDDTIHFLANYNRWRKLGVSPKTSVAHVLTHTGPALFVTTLVLVVAFATFAFSSFVPNINFGIMTAIVLSSALITDGTLLPALLLRGEAAKD